MAKRDVQEDTEADYTMEVDLEKYSIPDGTRCVTTRDSLSLKLIGLGFFFSRRIQPRLLFSVRNDPFLWSVLTLLAYLPWQKA